MNHSFPQLDQVCSALETRLSAGAPVIAAIDGRCGSGKSTLAALLQERFSCNVVHTDDFYLPPQRRADNWMEVPAGNMDLDRLLSQVLRPLRSGRPARYQPFSCQSGTLLEPVELRPGGLTLVEGSYSHHPLLAEHYGWKLFLTCSPEVQSQRLLMRAPERFDRFQRLWIPMEERYFRAFRILEHSDLVLDTGGCPSSISE